MPRLGRAFPPHNFYLEQPPAPTTTPVSSTTSAPAEATQKLAVTKSEPQEATQKLAVSRATVAEALVKLARVGSPGPAEANQGLKPTLAAPYEAVSKLAKTLILPYSAARKLAVTVQTVVEALQQVASVSSVSFVGAGSAAGSTSTTSLSPTVPAGIADNDYMVAALIQTAFNGNGLGVNTPAGWTLLRSVSQTGPSTADVWLAIYRRKASSEPASYSFDSAGGNLSYGVQIFAWRGANFPEDDSAIQNESFQSALTTPAKTTLADSTLALGFFSSDVDTVNFSATGGATSRADSDLGAVRLGVAEKLFASAGASATVTGSWSSSRWTSDAIVLLSPKATRPTVTAAYEGLLGLKQTVVAGFEALRKLAATSAGPADAGQGVAASGVDPAETLQTVAAAAADPAEASQTVAATLSGPYEAQASTQAVSQTAALAFETLQGLAATRNVPVEAMQLLAATMLARVEAVQKLAVSAAAPAEANTGLAVSAADPVEALQQLAVARATVAEALQQLAASATSTAEATQRIAGSLAAALESLQGVRATGSDPYEAQGSASAVSQKAAFWLEALQTVTRTGVLPAEAAQRLAVLGVTTAEWLQVVSATGGSCPLEALALVKSHGPTTESLPPDAIVELVNLSGSVSLIDENPEADGGDWLTATDPTVDTAVRVSFPSPAGALYPGELQTVAFLVRATGAGSPQARIDIYENGVLRKTGMAQTVTSTTGQIVRETFSRADLADPSGVDVEARLVGIAG